MTIPLPEPAGIIVVGTQALRAFTADQMRAAILAEREGCAKVCDVMAHNYAGSAAKGYTASDIIAMCAAAIRKGE